MFLRQNTAQVIRFGPCLDATDGVTEETALTLAQADMRLSKDGGAFAQKSAAGNATHDSDGWYDTTLSTTDVDTVGELRLNVHQPANMLPVWDRWWVIEEAVYDLLYGAGATGLVTLAAVTHTGAVIPTVTTLTGHTAQTADHTAGIADIPTVAEFNARTLVAASYFDPTADAVANVTLVAATTVNTDMRGTDGVDTATMRGTDGANTVIPPTVAELNARTLAAASYFDPAADTVANVALVATTTTNTDQRGTDGANIVIPPTEAQMNARTIVSANYALEASVQTLLGRITSTLFAGITSVAEWLGLLAGQQTANSTALTEIRATGAGSGTYSEATDSQEVLGEQAVSILARLPVRLTRNVAHANFHLFMVQTDGITPLTGATVTGGFTLDLTAEVAFAQAITELANGMYRIDLTGAQTNGLNVTYRFTATGGRDRVITFVTQP